MKSGIYKIINPINGKFYIGSSYDVFHRWKKHQQKLNSITHPNIHLQRAWTKNNGHFIFEVVEHCSTKIVVEREQYYLDTLKPHYNISPPADLNPGFL